MFEERAIFSDRDRFYQVWRQIAETDHFAFRAFGSGDGADQFRLEPGAFQGGLGFKIGEPANRLAGTCKLHSDILKLPRAVYARSATRLNIERRPVHCVTTAPGI